MIKLVSIIIVLLAGTNALYAQDYDLSNTSITITSPQDGKMVDVREKVEGTSSGIPDGYEIWISVCPFNTNGFFIQDQNRRMMANGGWSGTAFIGQPVSDSGLEFDILAILADEDANQKILDYVEKCKLDEKWPPLEELPRGAVIYDSVTVIRK